MFILVKQELTTVLQTSALAALARTTFLLTIQEGIFIESAVRELGARIVNKLT